MFSIILNVHNEQDTIEKDISNINKFILKKLKNPEFIIFQDGSTDKTHKILLRLKKKIKFIYNFKKKRQGIDQALHQSLTLCKKKYIFFLDGGNKFDINEFWSIYKFRNKYDLISGLRTDRKDQNYRKILTFLLNYFLRIFTKSKFKDIDSGFKLFKKKNISRILKLKKFNKHFYMSEICLKHLYLNKNYLEIPIKYFLRPTKSRALPLFKIPIMAISYIENFSSMINYLKKLSKDSFLAKVIINA